MIVAAMRILAFAVAKERIRFIVVLLMEVWECPRSETSFDRIDAGCKAKCYSSATLGGGLGHGRIATIGCGGVPVRFGRPRMRAQARRRAGRRHHRAAVHRERLSGGPRQGARRQPALVRRGLGAVVTL